MVTHYAEPVPHRVVWVSKQVRSPFNAVIGRNSPFGVFSHPYSMSGGLELSNPISNQTTSRSSFLSLPVVFADVHGNKYSWLSLKGTGLVTQEGIKVYGKPAGISTLTSREAGIFDWQYARHSRDASEALLKAGVRIAPDIAHIRILKQPSYGKRGVRRLKNFPKNLEPVVVLRAFGCRGRVLDASNPELVKEAMQAVKKELGKKRLTKQEYVTWLAKTVGENLALMHSRGWTHGFLHNQHNITLDGRFVDFDSLKGFGFNKHSSELDLTGDAAKDRVGALECVTTVASMLSQKKRRASLVFAAEITFHRAYAERAVKLSGHRFGNLLSDP